VSEKQDSEKLTTIVTAARKRLGHFGLAKTTMTEIAGDVGMSKASLYYYFPDKEHLFLAVIKQEMENFFTEVERLNEQSLLPEIQLTRYVDIKFRSFRESQNLSQLGSINQEPVRSAFAKFKLEFTDRETKIVQAILEKGMAQNRFVKGDAAKLADLFVAVLRGLRVLILKQRDSYVLTPEDHEQLKNHQSLFTSLYIKGITRQDSNSQLPV
jgi:AcrR family transcriptional regulator